MRQLIPLKYIIVGHRGERGNLVRLRRRRDQLVHEVGFAEVALIALEMQ